MLANSAWIPKSAIFSNKELPYPIHQRRCLVANVADPSFLVSSLNFQGVFRYSFVLLYMFFLQFFARPKVPSYHSLQAVTAFFNGELVHFLFTQNLSKSGFTYCRFPVGSIGKSKGVIKLIKLMYVTCCIVDVSA